MATEIYKSGYIHLIDGTVLYITPLKIKYLRQFMDKFNDVKTAIDDQEAISKLVDCALITMQQYMPEIDTVEKLEDVLNLPNIYKLLDYSAGIKIDKDEEEETVKDQAIESGSTWETMELAKLEAEAFLLGIWKDYEDLETSLSMPELTKTLESKRELEYQERKFLASIQGIDLEAGTDEDPQKKWEDMKARVFSGGMSRDANDIVSLQGANAQKAGFGIGFGLDYESFVEK